LSKRYRRVVALDEVSFSVRTGEVLGLIGPNGAGKTTLFECLAGVLPPSAGSIEGPGGPLAPGDRHRILFYLPDAIAPWPSETVRWALDFTIGFFGGRTDLRSELIDSLGLEPLLDSPIGTLSKGQRKRALLAVGLLSPQPVLLADEPFEGLDLRQSRDVAATLRVHAARGRTLFLSIHQIADAGRICDRFVLLSGGRTRGEGTLAELSERAAPFSTLEDVFLALT
jgi:ABC-2 type transport system ATP-binding protein